MSVQGFIDAIDFRQIRGWAIDLSNLNLPVRIDIFLGLRWLGAVAADMDRPDVKAAGLPKGDCGFCFRFPHPLGRGDLRQVRATPLGAEVALPGGVEDARRIWSEFFFPYHLMFTYASAAHFQPDELRDKMQLRGDMILPADSTSPYLDLNGAPVALERGLPTFGRSRDFWFVEHPDRLGFSAEIAIDRRRPWNDVWLCFESQGKNDRIPVVRIPTDQIVCPSLPPPENLARVIGSGASAWSSFIVAGATNVFILEHLLQKHLKMKVPARGTLLDWGCGCGRTTWALAARYPNATIIGVDIDRDNLDWTRKVAPRSRVVLSELFPKLLIEDESVDLIYSVSVFTHLTETAQNMWLEELDRILAPGGICVFTLQIEVTFLSLFFDLEAIEAYKLSGIQDHFYDPALQGFIEDNRYYRTTFHTSEYVRKNWQQYFDIIAIDPGVIGGHQDAVICVKRAGN